MLCSALNVPVYQSFSHRFRRGGINRLEAEQAGAHPVQDRAASHWFRSIGHIPSPGRVGALTGETPPVRAPARLTARQVRDLTIAERDYQLCNHQERSRSPGRQDG